MHVDPNVRHTISFKQGGPPEEGEAARRTARFHIQLWAASDTNGSRLCSPESLMA